MAMTSATKTTHNYLTREIPGLLFLFLAIITILSLVSFEPSDPSFLKFDSATHTKAVSNYIGLAGAYYSALLIDIIGLASYWLFVILLLFSWRFFRGHPFNFSWLITIGVVLMLFATASGFALFEPSLDYLGNSAASGGWAGKITSTLLVDFFNRIGAILFMAAMALVGLILSTGLSIIRIAAGSVDIFGRWRSDYRDNRTKKRERSERSKRLKDMLEDQKDRVAPQIVEKPAMKKAKPPAPKQEVFDWMVPEGPYTLPPLDLLDQLEKGPGGMSEESLLASSRLLEKKLADFNVDGKVVAVTSGPVITMFEFEPAPGVKISKIAGLADDLAMNMRAISIRIVAPLPGKPVVGIEIPNPKREFVSLREIVSSSTFQDSKSLLTLVMGVDIMGQPEVASLRRMPHLLIAGATGSGKSVGLNAMILSILLRARPEEVRFLMIDPKRIELTNYNDLPHLLYPVIHEPKMATQALKWAVAEMEERYRLLSDKGVRNIETYNRKIKQELAKKPLPAKKPKSEEGAAGEENIEEEAPPAPLPYLVIVIDELADLMMVSAREVEESITRLAQMARAAGIHLILATQRPSVDVLTGIIKANMPTRVSFQVSSKTDSRTILDTNGAENLLGNGDMLFMPPGAAKLTRIHGAFVSEDEIKRVTDYIKAQKEPDYLFQLTVKEEDDMFGEGDEDYDEKYNEAVELVTRSGRASISLIQRHLRVGYNRAARMIEIMEREGVVGPADGAKPRQILVKSYD